MNPAVAFDLERAVWPALLVDAKGAVLHANTAALGAFGARLAGDEPKLAAIWPDENGAAAEFLARQEKSPQPVVRLKFRGQNDEAMNYVTFVSIFSKEGSTLFMLQMMPDNAAQQIKIPAPVLTPISTPPPAPKPVVVAPAPASAPEIKTPVVAVAAEENKIAAPEANGLVLKQKLDCALQLARTVALDFNNALTGILGHTSFLLSKAEPGHPWRHSLMEVEKSAAHAAEIAHELQMFSRVEKEAHRSPPGNLNVVANRCADFFRNAHGATIAWKLQLEKNPFASRFDEAKVQQALTKILENAVEAVVAGNGQVNLQTRNVELHEPSHDGNVKLAAGTYICAEITDNGRGIEPDVLPRIFEPFFTTKKPPHRGLGLALVYGIVTNHGGGVAITSQPSVGTSVRIYLPAEKQLIENIAGAGDNLNGTETILIVDDENMLLTMGETILTDYGYKVLTANGGQKALAILARDDVKVDLVVTDLVMPGMGGRELTERIRQLAPKMKILCTSGIPSENQNGALYLHKPYTSTELLAKVKNILTSAASV